MANAMRRYFAPGKALWTLLVAALGCSIALLGCAESGKQGREHSLCPDCSYEAFREFVKEAIVIGMTEEEVINVLGEPLLRTVVEGWGKGEAVLLSYDGGRIEYLVYLLDGKVVKAELFYGYF